MLDKFKKFKKLRNMQNKLKKETVTVEKNGVTLSVNGEMKVQELSLNPDLDTEEQASIIKDCLNEAMDEMREKIAGSFM